MGDMMKKSKYNFFYEIEDGILAYNAKTNAMAVVEKEKIEELKKILAGEPSEDKKFVDELMYGGFIVKDYINELEEIRHDMYADRFSNNKLSLTIAPTSDCNFRCPYCYEKDVLHMQRMTDEVADKIVKFVENRAAGIENLHITWYGGEPLLEYQRILMLSEKFLEICDKHEIEYDAGIVTNGYLLTEDKLKKLIESKVSTIQITLDGTKESHDARRYLKNHGGTFDKIVSNLLSFEKLAQTIESFPNISIRMNLDRSNKEECYKLLDYINSLPLRKYVVPYVAGVYDGMDKEHVYTLTDSEYGDLKNEYLQEFEKKGFKIDYYAYYPKKVASSCCCDRIDSLVVDAHGNLYKCWEEIGFEEACIGQIGEDMNYNLPQCYYDYMLFDPTMNEECKECEVLPVCMGGGCPIRRVKDQRRNCEYDKGLVYDNIKRSAEKLNKIPKKRIEL